MKKRREEAKKQSGNLVETNKLNAKLFREKEYQKFLDKVNTYKYILNEIMREKTINQVYALETAHN